MVSEVERSIQVGDFGVGFGGDYWHNQANELLQGNHRFIRGNHDDPARCKSMNNYIADGTVEDDMMFVGGAWSIDYAWRTEGITWWPDEELSIEEFNRVIDIFNVVRPNIMVTHDAPMIAAQTMFINSGLAMFHKPLIPTRTGQALQAMYEIHQPKLWLYGHWHTTIETKIGDTTFICVGENDYIDIELDDFRRG
jgi:Icc-related predicted phosphoesterase